MFIGYTKNINPEQTTPHPSLTKEGSLIPKSSQAPRLPKLPAYFRS